ncbi:MAG: M20/M25/M40 family metallo-hydrolase [Clostridia bacterium]|nr:M20/M25/M40 family metallo-hydrolase [Clostridia bacterium]
MAACDAIFEKIEELYEAYLDIWEDVCKIESPTAYKKGVDAVGNYFIEMAKKRGWQVEIFEQPVAGNVIAITLNPESKEKPVTLSGHIDTVFPLGVFPPSAVHRDAENLYAPGSRDCKGGVVACFLAMEALWQCGFKARPVQLLIQSDEETGSKTSEKATIRYICEKAKNSIAFINTEGSTDGQAVLKRKGIWRCEFIVHGKAAHSSLCMNGANAIAEAAYKIPELEKMKDKAGLTCNIGVITGGTVANTVAETCRFVADIRFSDANELAEARKIIANVAETTHIEGCSCEVKEISYRPAMPLCERNMKLLEQMNAVFAENALPILAVGESLGGSDAAYATEYGIPCVDSLGVAGGPVHSNNEYGNLRSLALSAKQMASVAYCI